MKKINRLCYNFKIDFIPDSDDEYINIKYNFLDDE